MKNRKIGRKPDRKMPAPTSGDELIVLTGLVHTETGRQLVFCTADGAEGFFLGPEDMGSPDGGKGLAARCERCGGDETHWIMDFRTALSEGRVSADVDEGDHVLSNLSLIKNLVEVGGAGPVANPAPARKAATS